MACARLAVLALLSFASFVHGDERVACGAQDKGDDCHLDALTAQLALDEADSEAKGMEVTLLQQRQTMETLVSAQSASRAKGAEKSNASTSNTAMLHDRRRAILAALEALDAKLRDKAGADEVGKKTASEGSMWGKMIKVEGGMCLAASDSSQEGGVVNVVYCDPNKMRQRWEYVGNTFRNQWNMCMARFAGSSRMEMRTCTSSSPLQQFRYNTLGGRNSITDNGDCLTAAFKNQNKGSVSMLPCVSSGSGLSMQSWIMRT